MTSQERRDSRYQRRKAKRLMKKMDIYSDADDFDRVFTYRHLYESYRKCIKGVGWKSSVQRYKANATLNLYATYKTLHNGTFRSDGFYEFDIAERGKIRHIKSVKVNERIVQRCLCDYSLVPMLRRTFIYDNGATLKDKGYDFSVRRFKCHLSRYYRKHGNNGYILLFDFQKFFDNVPHELLKKIIREEFSDERLIKLYDYLIDSFGNVGLGLGSQISQVLALASANQLDHHIKDVMRLKYYGRYMDDGYIIHRDKTYLTQCLAEIERVCDNLGIHINKRKTRIVRLDRQFTFLKIRTQLLGNGKILMKPCKNNITRMRRKIKKLRAYVDRGALDESDVYAALQAWESHMNKFQAHYAICSMRCLYSSLYPGRCMKQRV